ncbi:MAG: peptide chain release factor N(5)-glutamine methyltransferase [Planctomycetia bacterium]|nr:peptide chain release factor N(5)-glutamine methyltransferase [Planctomycetia bacterium]
MAQTETWTVGRLLQWTAQYLKERGSDSPRLDAEVLLAHARGCRRIELYTAYDQEPSETQRTAFRELVRRRAEGAPVAYLVGEREFYSLPFRVTPDVLIPRPETELLVIRLLDLAGPRKNEPLRICDVGTGSGIIAICAAKHLPQARLTALDISPKALDVARQNAQRHGVTEQIAFVQSDLFSALPPGERFDFVVGNPPYVTTREMTELPPDVRNHEPRQALDAGERGLNVIEPLVRQSETRVVPGGYLLFEISPMLRDTAAGLFGLPSGAEDGRPRAPWADVQFIKDHAGRTRVVQARRT